MLKNIRQKNIRQIRYIKRIWALVLAAALFVGAFPVNASAASYAKKIGTAAKIKAGYYRIIPYCAPKRMLTVQNASKKSGANVYINAKDNTKPSKVFYIKPIGNSLYTIRNLNSGKYVEIAGGKNKAHTNVQQGTYSGKKRQKWYIIKKNGKYVFQSSYCRLVMTVRNSKNANKVNVWTNKYLGTKGQMFRLQKVSASAVKSMTKKTSTAKKTTAKTATTAKKTTAKTTTSTAKKTTTASTAKTTTASTTQNTKAGTTSEAASAVKNSFAALTGYKTSSRTWSDSRDPAIMTNIIGAVESGGQIYGRRDYAAYAGAYTNSAIEYTCTLGWAQFYGSEAKKLVVNIYNKNKTAFVRIVKKYYPDKNGSTSSGYKAFMEKVTTDYSWAAKKWDPDETEQALLIELITTTIGKKCQDELFESQMASMIAYCRRNYTSNAWAVHMYCEIRHLGGISAANRIFNRCRSEGSYSLGMILAVLALDQLNTASDNQVGDLKYWTRHLKCAEFLETYAA